LRKQIGVKDDQINDLTERAQRTINEGLETLRVQARGKTEPAGELQLPFRAEQRLIDELDLVVGGGAGIVDQAVVNKPAIRPGSALRGTRRRQHGLRPCQPELHQEPFVASRVNCDSGMRWL